MLPSFGWTEMLMIAIVLIVVIGPKDAIKMMRSVSQQIKSFRRMAGDMQRQFNDALEDADLGDVKDMAAEMRELDPRKQMRDAFKPLEDMGRDVADELNAPDNLDAPAKKPTKAETAADDGAASIQPKAIVSLDSNPPVKAPAKKPATRKQAAKKPAAKKPASKNAPAAKSPAKKAPAKRAPARKTAAKAKTPETTGDKA
ncbi:MAG: Sec-independent protein translocase protein TatB [Pseudomonadota bacterium]